MSSGMFLIASRQLAVVCWPISFPIHPHLGPSGPAAREEGAELSIAEGKVQLGSEGAISGVKAMESALSSKDASNKGALVPLTIELAGASTLPFAIGENISFVVCRYARCSKDLAKTRPTNDKET